MKQDVGNTEADQHEYAEASNAHAGCYVGCALKQPHTGECTDEKGRPVVMSMSDRDILRETLATLRALADVLEAVGQSPMAAAMMPGLGALGKR